MSKDDSTWIAVTIQVDGVPPGQESNVTVTFDETNVHDHAGCQRRGASTYICVATSPRSSFPFHASSTRTPRSW